MYSGLEVRGPLPTYCVCTVLQCSITMCSSTVTVVRCHLVQKRDFSSAPHCDVTSWFLVQALLPAPKAPGGVGLLAGG